MGWLLSQSRYDAAPGASVASESAQVFGGHSDDPANAALVVSDLGAAQFADATEIANNVALRDLSVPLAGIVTMMDPGFASGDADPYFSLLAGSGDAATFLAPNHGQAFSAGGDFSSAGLLAAGACRLANGTLANLLFAEN